MQLMKSADCKLLAGLVLAALGLATPAIAKADPAVSTQDTAMITILNQRAADAVAAMRGSKDPREVFTPEFNAVVPPEKLHELTAQLVAGNGAITGQDSLVVSAPWAARFAIQFERSTAGAAIQLESAAPHRIAGFRITSVTPRGDSLAAITADFDALPGVSGFSIARLSDGAPVAIAARHAQNKFAVGSSFKLWVLEALAEQVRLGKRRWSDVVPLGAPSLPSGIMQEWPRGTAVTLETLATLMISKSDNTATDTLIGVVGKDAIEARLAATGVSDPTGMTPFLTTLEAFTLKTGSETEKTAWASAAVPARRAMLAALGEKVDARKIDWSLLETGKPNAIDRIEWFASPDDVVRVLDALRRQNDPHALAILAIAPMLPEDRRAKFAYAGYKGGSEAGVISLNWLLQSQSGQYYAVSASWNDTQAKVDDAHFAVIAQRLTAFLD